MRLLQSIWAAAILGVFAVPAWTEAGIGLVRDKDIWWFKAADGSRFLCKGVNCVGPGKTKADYDPRSPEYSTFVHVGDAYEEWERRTLGRLRAWGFNTIGGWSDERLYKADIYTTPFLNYQVEFGSIWFDLWSEDYESKAEQTARRITKPFLENPRVAGYWMDNEFGWGDDYFLSLYLEYPDWMGDRAKAPGKRRLIELLKRLYRNDFRMFLRDFETPAGNWDGLFSTTSTGRRPGKGQRVIDAWLEEIGRRYYSTAARTLKAADPRHLIMGDRFRQFYPQGVARAARGNLDIISTNFEATTADGWISPVYFETLYELSGCPIIIGEVYATARQNRTGNRNHGGYFTLTDTQAQRAAAAAAQIRQYAAFPFVVGWHWFQYSDEPVFGRSDGENYNMGLVDMYDEPYAELTSAIAEANAQADAAHAASGAPAPEPPDPLPVRRQTGLLADGRLGDWDKSSPAPRALLKAENGLAPFADFFLAWTETDLWIAIRAYEFTYPQKAKPHEGDPATWGVLNRLYIDVGDADIRAATGTLAKEGHADGIPVTYALAPPRGVLSPAISSHMDSWHYVWEIAVPASATGRERFAAGDRLNLKLRIENRGDFEKMSLGGTRGIKIELE